MKTYNQLTEIQRYQIEALNKAEKKQNEIAKILGISPSTISHEFFRSVFKYIPRCYIWNLWTIR